MLNTQHFLVWWYVKISKEHLQRWLMNTRSPLTALTKTWWKQEDVVVGEKKRHVTIGGVCRML
jgi:hypothetical protein